MRLALLLLLLLLLSLLALESAQAADPCELLQRVAADAASARPDGVTVAAASTAWGWAERQCRNGPRATEWEASEGAVRLSFVPRQVRVARAETKRTVVSLLRPYWDGTLVAFANATVEFRYMLRSTSPQYSLYEGVVLEGTVWRAVYAPPGGFAAAPVLRGGYLRTVAAADRVEVVDTDLFDGRPATVALTRWALPVGTGRALLETAVRSSATVTPDVDAPGWAGQSVAGVTGPENYMPSSSGGAVVTWLTLLLLLCAMCTAVWTVWGVFLDVWFTWLLTSLLYPTASMPYYPLLVATTEVARLVATGSNSRAARAAEKCGLAALWLSALAGVAVAALLAVDALRPRALSRHRAVARAARRVCCGLALTMLLPVVILFADIGKGTHPKWTLLPLCAAYAVVIPTTVADAYALGAGVPTVLSPRRWRALLLRWRGGAPSAMLAFLSVAVTAVFTGWLRKPVVHASCSKAAVPLLGVVSNAALLVAAAATMLAAADQTMRQAAAASCSSWVQAWRSWPLVAVCVLVAGLCVAQLAAGFTLQLGMYCAGGRAAGLTAAWALWVACAFGLAVLAVGTRTFAAFTRRREQNQPAVPKKLPDNDIKLLVMQATM
eukprot:TRINITY_DN5893_c0_g6_i1.p1 TRINITY_DN5893_c0_g6~~TRINITY_DN5893_c0_g6_i1.p1  ORF type:complete len:609 (-),score=129.99 TRINITY_DN5893_c0_g6_i1:54-1880(-)